MKNFYNIATKSLILIIILILIFFVMSNSFSSQNIDKLAYVVALGIDVGDSNNIKLSIQLAKPSSVTSSSSSQSSTSVVNSVDCSSVATGINLFNSYISRSINLSHCKVVVFSEKLASQGISKYLYDLSNNVEVSSHANIIITKCSANDYLKMTTPTLENLPARYYEIVNTSSKITGYTKSNSLIDFFSLDVDTLQQPVAVLANINTSDTHYLSSENDFSNKDSSYKAGQTPIDSSNNIENMGLAIFRDAKMVGELNGLESICHLIMCGNLKYCTLQVKDPNDSNTNIDLNLALSGKPKIQLKLINGYAYIISDVKLNAQIVSANGNSNYSNADTIDSIENELNLYLEKELYNYLYKISKQYNSDIDGFGKYVIKDFSTQQNFDDFDWLNNFQNSFFKITVKSKIKSSSNFTNS